MATEIVAGREFRDVCGFNGSAQTETLIPGDVKKNGNIPF